VTESGRGFEAWALPRAAARPAVPSIRVDDELTRLDVEHRWIEGLADGLIAAGDPLRMMPLDRIVRALGSVGARFLDPEDALRHDALRHLPGTSGLSPEMSAAVLDGMAIDWQPERLTRLIEVEFPDISVLDRFTPEAGRRVRAFGARLCVQIVSGSVPGVGTTALIRSLLTRAPTLLKPGLGDVVLPVLFARALGEVEPLLADAVAVVYWPGGQEALEEAAMSRAEVVCVYGGDVTVKTLTARAPVTARIVAYHHRVSVGAVARDALRDERSRRVASDVAGSVAFFDQRGCVSPQIVYVEEGGAVSPREFAGLVAEALAVIEGRLPGGRLDAAEASALHQARGSAELSASAGSGLELLDGGLASWTVVYDPEGSLPDACTGRFVRVRPVGELLDLPELLGAFGDHLQTVGVAAPDDRIAAFAEQMGRAGATRIAPFDAVPFPPPWWRQDGMEPLRALVRWVDLEEGG
jgi:Acyl-CoA reductase (LuxC)